MINDIKNSPTLKDQLKTILNDLSKSDIPKEQKDLLVKQAKEIKLTINQINDTNNK